MKVVLHSPNPKLGDVEANVAAIVAAVHAAGKEKADLVVFPEMFLSGYNIGDEAQRLALKEASGTKVAFDQRLLPLVLACQKHHVSVIAGCPSSPRRGITHNSALLVSSDGTVQYYHKRCLPTFTTFSEGLFFTQGKTSPVWTVPTRSAPVKLGIHICYDLYFPEHQKSQVLAGADVLVNISASPAPSRRFFETLLQARAIENACFSLYSNNCGAQDGLVFWGGSQAVGPRGQVIGQQTPYEEGRLVVELDLDQLTAAREFRPTIRDSEAVELDLKGHPIKALQNHTHTKTPSTSHRSKSKPSKETPSNPAGRSSPAKPSRKR